MAQKKLGKAGKAAASRRTPKKKRSAGLKAGTTFREREAQARFIPQKRGVNNRNLRYGRGSKTTMGW